MNPPDALSGAVSLAPKIVSEVHELHERNVSLSHNSGALRGRRGRRERREARDAERDLLRVLGFDSYEEFVARTNPAAPVAAPPADPGLVLVTDGTGNGSGNGSGNGDGAGADGASVSSISEAQETEAALLRVLRAEGRASAAAEPTATPGPLWVADVHARLSACEEELAETRFELMQVRDKMRGERAGRTEPDSAVPSAAAALVEAAAELRSLCELLRQERAELATLGSQARAQAAEVLETARSDAQAVRDAAAAEARAALDRASADAVALTRNALSTVDGLRRLAAEDGSDERP
ncbi:MAG TPA: hypothetical protein VL119_01595 [Acidimicrobiia bacterium]|nr:hypothetical protein [Acidimicrobiia bacterium]